MLMSTLILTRRVGESLDFYIPHDHIVDLLVKLLDGQTPEEALGTVGDVDLQVRVTFAKQPQAGRATLHIEAPRCIQIQRSEINNIHLAKNPPPANVPKSSDGSVHQDFIPLSKQTRPQYARPPKRRK